MNGVMKRWVEYFEMLLNSESREDEQLNTVVEENQETLYDEPQLQADRLSLEEVNIVISVKKIQEEKERFQ